MGLGTALSTAISGLNINQAGLQLVSRNVSNAGTPGYTRKTLTQENIAVGGGGFGVRQNTITRDVNEFLQQQLHTELGINGSRQILSQFLDRLDLIYGQPGSDTALDTAVNRLSGALQDLATSPESDTARNAVKLGAEQLVSKLNQLSENIQTLRRDAESGISHSVNEANELLQSIAALNTSVQESYGTLTGSADTEDQRDQLINRLSELIDISVSKGDRGSVRVYTSNGDLLVDGVASRLTFDEHGNIGPQSLYSPTDAERGVGTIKIVAANGSTSDLIRGRSNFGGTIGGYLTLRDDILVEAQTQLDELAHGLALSFSDYTNTGTAVSSGAQDGFDLDVTGLLAGNQITINYTEGGTSKTVTFVRVDDATTLPLSDDVTPNPNDSVVGIDFSGGLAGAAASMSTALGAAISVANTAGNTIRFLDDGAAATVDISDVNARITATALSDKGTQLPLFQDAAGKAYSGALDGADQKLGFASRITLNGSVAADSSWLVNYSTSPATGASDATRPIELVKRLTEQSFDFDPATGIGSANAPYKGSVDEFARRIIASQTGRSEMAAQSKSAQEIVVGALQKRISSESGVNIDEEMANLIELQNAYTSSARVITAIKEMTEMLMRM
ncbi:MAG TPA: flagellar hook-associated protein FlgK [Rhizobiales bacterium]|nr:flagellar hook-associated protein FlgK [Hyphomicrobiales bacterium]